jgi:hypothetical protein
MKITFVYFDNPAGSEVENAQHRKTLVDTVIETADKHLRGERFGFDEPTLTDLSEMLVGERIGYLLCQLS